MYRIDYCYPMSRPFLNVCNRVDKKKKKKKKTTNNTRKPNYTGTIEGV